jgi:RHS repeat-associated protein
MSRSSWRGYLPRTRRSRWITSIAVLVAVAGLVASVLVPAAQAPNPGRPGAGIQPAVSFGSLQHYPWWDPRHWTERSAPTSTVLADAVHGVPRRGRLPHQAALRPARRVAELAGRRSENARVYQLSDGRLQAVISAVPVNYRDPGGRWQPISTAVRPAVRPGYAYANTTNTFRSFFGATAGQLVRFEAPGGGWLSIGLAGGRVGRPQVSGDTVTYRDLAPGVDLSYQVTPQSLEERITLASPAAAAPLASLVFAVRAGGGLVPYQRPDGAIVLSRDGTGGAPVLVLPAPFMTDARADRSSPYGMAWSPKVSQHASWDAAAGLMRLTVTPDAGWLGQAARRFPVVIDPTIAIAPDPASAQNTMIISDPGASSSNYSSSWRLSVGTDAGGAVRSLLSFPLTAVPPGTQLDSADLELYYDQVFGPGTAKETIEAHQATAPWQASTATWATAGNNVGQLGSNQVTVTSSDPAYAAADGAWPAAVDSNAVGGAYRYDQDSVSGDTFTWVPRLTESGSYQVEAHYVANAAAASNAPYTVSYNGGSVAYTVNQQSGSGGVWATLGSQPFAAGNTGKIVLGDGPASASTRVEADAVRLTLPGSVSYDPALNTWNVFPVRNIVQSWLDGTSPNYGFVVKAADESALNVGGPRYEASRAAYNGETATYPQLVLTYGTLGVTLNPITTIHSTGAELSWPAYTDPTPGSDPGDDLAGYQVHRSVTQSFTPSADTLVAPVDPATTSFTDTTAVPTPPGTGAAPSACYYMVAVQTQDGSLIPGPVQRAQLPTAGSTVRLINASGDTTLSSAQPATNEQQFTGQPYLGAGDNSATYGVTRTVVGFPSLASAGIPGDATVTGAELKLWGWYNYNTGGGPATYEAHALTQNFDPATATWNNASSSTAWATPGGNYSATAAGTVSGVTGDPGWLSWPVTAIAQDWLTTPADEHGLLVKLSGEDSASPQERELFLNSSAVEPKLRPELAVTYTEPTPQDTYYVPDLPNPLTASSSYSVNVTLTNTTSGTWAASDWVLSYHWLLPDGTDASNSTNQAQTPLPADMAPGAVATIAATLKAPDNTGSGGTRTGYTLQWDLYDQTDCTWLSGWPTSCTLSATTANTSVPAAANGVPPLQQFVPVDQPTSNKLGLEKFYQYTGVNTGAGSSVLNNLSSGNAVWSYNAFSNPSRGFATFVRMAYNSLDTSDSSMGFGWSLQASTVQRLGTPLDFHPRPNPTTITLTDGDGTSHLFVLGSTGVWQSPPGIHLFLQQIGQCDPSGKTDNSRAWVMTKPDRTQFFFDCQGFQSAVVDRNGNEADFTYAQRKSNNKPVKFLQSITDPAGRQTLTISYYAKGDSYSFIDANGNVASATGLTNPFIIDQVKSITDISGRTITFLYDTKGLMSQMTDGDGTSVAKVFKFGYDPTQGNKNVKLVSVTDPRGNTTGLAYNLPKTGDNPAFHWLLKSVTDRRGGTTSFAYTTPDSSGNTTCQVTDQNGHTSTDVLDAAGRPVQMTNALNQVTKLAFDSDNNVTSLTEANGAVTTYTYDPNTGYLLTQTDAVANNNSTASTTYTYQTGLSGHIANLIAKLSPQQRLWTFGYDTNGNLTSVTDPDGNAVSPPSGFTTSYTYDAAGQLLTATDPNHNTTSYSNYDPNGFPRTITDALNNATTFAYDVRGEVTTVTDPLGHVTTQAYDVFGRPEQKVMPKDQGAGVFITAPAPVYDGDDNVTQSTAPNGAVTTATYDPNDELNAQFAPQDTATSPQRETTFTYDPAGNLTSVTEPDGNVPSPASSFTTTFTYDAINERISATDANGGVTTTGHDNVGNVTSVTDPLGHEAKFAYDLDHRQTSATDPAGFSTSQTYDLDGLVLTSTDRNGSRTLFTLDPRGKVTQAMVPHDTSGASIVYNTTQYVYDQVGNRIKVITPRGAASGGTDAFTQQTKYDADNRVQARLSAFDPNDPVYNTAAETDYSYDAAGRLASVSAPPSGNQTLRNVTTYTYFDNGWTKSSTDPWDITTSYDYNDLGEQKSRTITSAGGSASRTVSWTYFPDGKLQSRADDGVPTGLATELVDDSDFNNTTSTGTWTASSAGTGFEGPGYQTHAPGTGTDTFTWTLNIPQDGNYTVLVKFPAVPGAATNASYKVSFSGGSATATVDQTQNAGTWVPLGKFAFTRSGTGQNVTLAENPGGTVVADAVQIVRDNSGETNTAHHTFGDAYDPNGNLTEIIDTSPGTAISDYQASYDGLNRITQLTELAAGVTKHTTTYGYDADSNLTSRGHDGATSSYAYDLRNLLTKQTDAQSASDPSPQVTTFTYTPVGQLLTEVKPNGNTVNDSYFADWSLQHSTETTPSGATVAEHTYTYNPNGDKTQDIEKLMSADDNSADLTHTLGYTYDPRDRIAQVTKDGTVTESYAHDANDNVTAQTINGTSTTFNFDRNRLLTAVIGAVTASYNYDPFGRLDTVISGGQVQQRNTYDGFDHIIEHQQLSPAGGLVTTDYTYDPLDRRTSQTTGAGTSSPQTTSYAYIGLTNQLISELQNGTQTKSYTYTPGGSRLAQITDHTDGTQTPGYYTYNDHSDVQAVTGSHGNTTATYGYTAYGQNDTSQFTGQDKNNTSPASSSQPFNAYRYNAMRWDSSSGQYDMGFRNYDPSLNQFLSRDMYNGALTDMGLDTDPFTGNRYTFGAGNPLSNIEFTGHQFLMPVGGGGCDSTTPGCPGSSAPTPSPNPAVAQQSPPAQSTQAPTCSGDLFTCALKTWGSDKLNQAKNLAGQALGQVGQAASDKLNQAKNAAGQALGQVSQAASDGLNQGESTAGQEVGQIGQAIRQGSSPAAIYQTLNSTVGYFIGPQDYYTAGVSANTRFFFGVQFSLTVTPDKFYLTEGVGFGNPGLNPFAAAGRIAQRPESAAQIDQFVSGPSLSAGAGSGLGLGGVWGNEGQINWGAVGAEITLSRPGLSPGIYETNSVDMSDPMIWHQLFCDVLCPTDAPDE